MSNTSQTRAQADLITMTRGDLIALGEKFAGHENCDISKPQAFNMIAAAILGPKHDWAQIKNAKTPITSQRARNIEPAEQKRPTEILTEMKDGHTGEYMSARARITQDGSMEVDISDGTTVWIERNENVNKVHVYNDLSDGPVSIFSEPTHRLAVKQEAYEANAWDDIKSHPLAGENKSPIIGYQVDSPETGENWNNRPSYLILTYKTAMADLEEAKKNGKDDFRLLPIREGTIEEPEFE